MPAGPIILFVTRTFVQPSNAWIHDLDEPAIKAHLGDKWDISPTNVVDFEQYTHLLPVLVKKKR
ncbi:MAG TPA: hypothetical protein VGO47_12130 [Chlamydiales bacterium]|nr:hypothetical protein [Chlamydiales bacterium]